MMRPMVERRVKRSPLGKAEIGGRVFFGGRLGNRCMFGHIQEIDPEGIVLIWVCTGMTSGAFLPHTLMYSGMCTRKF